MKYFNNTSGTLEEYDNGVTTFIEYPALTIDQDDVIYIVYRDLGNRRLYTINNASGSFSTTEPITPVASGRPCYYRTISVDEMGRLYVAYQNSNVAAPKGFFLVHGFSGDYCDPITVMDDQQGYTSFVNASVASRNDGEIAVLISPAQMRKDLI